MSSIKIEYVPAIFIAICIYAFVAFVDKTIMFDYRVFYFLLAAIIIQALPYMYLRLQK